MVPNDIEGQKSEPEDQRKEDGTLTAPAPPPPSTMKMRVSGEAILYLNVSLYALCYQLQRPIEPFLISHLGVKSANTAFSYGALQSFFNLVQTFGAPIIGILLDRYSARVGFAVAFAASAASYFLLANATTLPLLYLSKVPTALQHGFLCAQAVAVTSFHTESERAAALGRLTASYTIGATIGPALGGYLGASKDYYLGARFACYGSLLSCFLALAGPGGKSVSTPLKKNDEKEKTSREPFSWSTGIRVASSPSVRPLMLTKLIVSCANGMMGAAAPMILKDFYGFDEQALGYYFSASSFCNAIFGAFAIGWLSKALSSAVLVDASIAVVALCFGLQGFIPFVSYDVYSTGWVLSGIGASLAGHALATVITASASSQVDEKERGALVGFEHGIFSAARIFTPGLGVMIMGVGGAPAVGAACSCFGFVALQFFRRR